ncbi:MAG: hypothetical protein LBU32_21365 [Clostridiales bacterium]|nr:hypothetical protein [Clostridiales bacterium]
MDNLSKFISFIKDYFAERKIKKTVDKDFIKLKVNSYVFDQIELIKQISYEEKFGLAIAAPFRACTFKGLQQRSKEGKKPKFPKHFYMLDQYRDQEGAKRLLSIYAGARTQIQLMLAISSAVNNALVSSGNGSMDGGLSSESCIIRLGRNISAEPSRCIATLHLSYAAFLVTTGSDAKLLTKEEALAMLKNINRAIRFMNQKADAWKEFSAAFLKEEFTRLIFPSFSSKSLAKAAVFLLDEPIVSPWRHVSFDDAKLEKGE